MVDSLVGAKADEEDALVMGDAVAVGALAATDVEAFGLSTSRSWAPDSRRTLCPETESTELPSGPPPTFSFMPRMPTTCPGITAVGPL